MQIIYDKRDGEICRVCTGGQLRENTAMDKKNTDFGLDVLRKFI